MTRTIRNLVLGVAAGSALAAAAPASASIVITEFSRGGGAGEFVEITNIGNSPIDLTGWSFDDAGATPGAFPIGALGIVAPGESAIISELDAATFRAAWGLADTVKIAELNDQNLGNGDAMNIFDAADNLIDTMSYPGSQSVVDGETWVTTPDFYGADDFGGWVRSSAGDAFGSWASSANYFGSPGVAPVPEPAALGLLGAGALLMVQRRRRA